MKIIFLWPTKFFDGLIFTSNKLNLPKSPTSKPIFGYNCCSFVVERNFFVCFWYFQDGIAYKELLLQILPSDDINSLKPPSDPIEHVLALLSETCRYPLTADDITNVWKKYLFEELKFKGNERLNVAFCAFMLHTFPGQNLLNKLNGKAANGTVTVDEKPNGKQESIGSNCKPFFSFDNV